MAWRKSVVESAKLIRDKIGSRMYQDLIKQGFPLPSDKVLQYNCGSSRRDARMNTIKDHYDKLNVPDPVKASVSIKGLFVMQSVSVFKGGYFKDDRRLGGRGGRPNAVSISNNDVIV